MSTAFEPLRGRGTERVADDEEDFDFRAREHVQRQFASMRVNPTAKWRLCSGLLCLLLVLFAVLLLVSVSGVWSSAKKVDVPISCTPDCVNGVCAAAQAPASGTQCRCFVGWNGLACDVPSTSPASPVDPALSQLAATVRAAMNFSVNPCDDFYEYACGSWLAANEIPSDRGSYSRSFSVIDERNQQQLKSILEDKWPLIGTLYESCMDTTTIDSRGTAPLTGLLKMTESVKDLVRLIEVVAQLHLSGMSPLFSFYVAPDSDNPDLNIAHIDQGGFGLERDSYFSQEPRDVKMREEYQAHMSRMFQLLPAPYNISIDHAHHVVEQVFKFEMSLANASLSREDRRNPETIFNKIGVSGLSSLAPSITWVLFFEVLGLPPTTAQLDVAVKAFFSNLDDTLTTTPLDVVVHYLRWRIARENAYLLSAPFRDEMFRWRQFMSGVDVDRPRWKQCASVVDESLGDLLGHHFVRLHFSPESKSAVEDLISRIRGQFKTMVDVPWLTRSTVVAAKAKADALTIKVGYPSVWRKWDDVAIRADLFYESVASATQSLVAESFAEFGKKVDKTHWVMTASTVNAYYSPDSNEIVFPAGILQEPFFNNAWPAAMWFGGIGVVIGHETGHAFDDQGRRYDGTGKLTKWWTDADIAQFETRAQCVSRYYSNYEALPGLHVVGNLTLGENLADMGGLKSSLAAYRAFAAETKVDTAAIQAAFGMTHEQLFFTSFAQTWCTKYKTQTLENLVKTNVHSPSKFRINGPTSNLAAFGEAFSCAVGSPMRPASQCAVW